MSFETVFDIEQSGYTTWWVPLALLVGTLLGTFFLLAAIQDSENRNSRTMIGGLIVAGFAFSALIEGYSSYSQFAALKHDLKIGRFRQVSGIVKDYVSEQPDDKRSERFSVGNAHFDYTTAEVTSAFHWTALHGGPIHAGEFARISYVSEGNGGNAIIRVEVNRR